MTHNKLLDNYYTTIYYYYYYYYFMLSQEIFHNLCVPKYQF